MTVTETRETAVPANAGHPLDQAPLPYWLNGPCPSWCTRPHCDNDSSHGDERLHNGDDVYMDLSQEPHGDAGGAPCISAGIWQGYRDARPHILLTLNDKEELYLELPEAEELARLLDSPQKEWASLLPTMMDTEIITPLGLPCTGPTPHPVAHFAAFPFTRMPVVAVCRVLDTVTVFTFVQAGPDHEQSPRYVALTPGEAAELAAAITKLLASADEAIPGPAEVTADGTCPPWCEIDDHQDWDEGRMQHSTWTSVPLTAYPYQVTTGGPGEPQVTTTEHDSLMIRRDQVRDHEPAVVITLPDEFPRYPHLCDPDEHIHLCDPDEHIHLCDPDEHIGLPDSQVLLNFAEAQETAVALLVMAGRLDRSPHIPCAPGDPSPCCPDSPLRASAYPSAVFCPGCGSLYWRTQDQAPGVTPEAGS